MSHPTRRRASARFLRLAAASASVGAVSAQAADLTVPPGAAEAVMGAASGAAAAAVAVVSSDAVGLLHRAQAWLASLMNHPLVTHPPSLPESLDTTQLMAIAAAMGWASGLRLYAVVFLTGLAGMMGWVHLPSGLHLLEHPVMLGASGLMLAVEFFADKIPGVDSVWDALHTFIRIPAGAALAATVFGGDQSVWMTAAALMGGSLAATSHLAKSSTRAAANTSPEPFSNILLSLAGDAIVPATLWMSWHYPLLSLAGVAVASVVMLIVIVMLWQFVRRVLRRLRGDPATQARPASAVI